MTLAFQRRNFDPSLYANYLLIVYAFFLPISHKISSIVMLFFALCVLLSGNLKERFKNIINDKIIIAFILFYLLHFIWMIGSEHLHFALLKLKEFKYLLYLIPIAMVLKKEFIQKILAGFVSAMFFSELVSYSMHFGITIPLIPLTANAMNVPFMEWHTQYSAILSITLGILLYQLLTNKDLNLYFKILYTGFFISASLNIFIIASRIGYSLYALSILTVLLIIYKQQLLKILLVGFFIILSGYITAYLSSDLFKSRVSEAISDIRMISEGNLATSLGARAGFHIYSYEVIKHHLLFGVGTADHISMVSQQVYSKELNPKNIEGILCNVRSGHNASLHSEYLDTVVQFGIVGLLIFLNIFYQIYRYPQSNDLLKMIQLLTISVMLFVSLGSVIFIHADIGKIFVLLIALTLSIKPLTFTSAQRST